MLYYIKRSIFEIFFFYSSGTILALICGHWDAKAIHDWRHRRCYSSLDNEWASVLSLVVGKSNAPQQMSFAPLFHICLQEKKLAYSSLLPLNLSHFLSFFLNLKPSDSLPYCHTKLNYLRGVLSKLQTQYFWWVLLSPLLTTFILFSSHTIIVIFSGTGLVQIRHADSAEDLFHNTPMVESQRGRPQDPNEPCISIHRH